MTQRVKLEDLPPHARAAAERILREQDERRAAKAPSPAPDPPAEPKRSRARCGTGHGHANKREAAVCDRLSAVAFTEGLVIFVGVRFPLWSLAPNENGRPATFTPDFALIRFTSNGVAWVARVVDAKPSGKGAFRSPEWSRGKRAFESAYGITVEEMDA